MFTLRKKQEFVESFQNYFGGQKDPLWLSFVKAFFDSAPAQTLEDPSDHRIFDQIKRAWDFYKEQKRATLAIQHSYDDLSRKITLEIFQPDQPFIVETLRNCLRHHQLMHGTLYHPVLKAKRDSRGAVKDILTHATAAPSEDYIYESLLSTEVEIPAKAIDFNIKAFIEDLTWRMNLIGIAVGDWPRMRTHIQKLIPLDQQPEHDFFNWLYHDNFLFLGLRYFPISDKKTASLPQKDKSFGLFRDDHIRRTKDFLRKQHVSLPQNSEIFHIEKTNIRSPINRPARIDLIEVVCEDTQEICQMIGIFTRRSYNESIFQIPLLKDKAYRIFEGFGLKRTWHDGKNLEKALQSIPHDEYWHFSENIITELCAKVLGFHVQSLPVFAIQQSERVNSTTLLVFLGRDRYSVELRDIMGNAFATHLGGALTSSRGIVDDAPFARLVFAVDHASASPNLTYLQDIIETLSLSWDEKRRKLQGFSHLHDPMHQYFEEEYKKDFLPEQAVVDSTYFQTLGDTKRFSVEFSVLSTPRPDTFSTNLSLRVFSLETPIVLSHLLESLKNYDITIAQEKTYPIKHGAYYLHVCSGTLDAPSLEAQHRFHICEMIEATLAQSYPNDKFNKLFAAASFNWRQVMVMRALGEYCLQAQYPYSYTFIAEVLSRYSHVTKLLLRLFEEKFSPEISAKKRELLIKNTTQEFITALDQVTSFDQDQLFRDLKGLIDAMVRTNYFLEKSYVSFKFKSHDVPRLKDPLPLFEVFVSSSLMQGIHLRSSKVARGGIRYSDRAGDFRTEVLQLMQAQDLKNALIVPTGAKGGFILKKNAPTPEDVQEAYKNLIRGLLDVTDNRKEGKILKNPKVVAQDEDDTYLVVAADKGTATFSDLANSLSAEYDFWLGDAFASGGAHGYDHKKLGITAKGAFISVAHHLQKCNLNPSVDPITVVGVGDMAGDVFGNGMLLYNTFKLVGAFNHRHIFIDPHPIPEDAYRERKRLFENPKLSWADYNPRALSPGGAIYERSSKTLKLSSHAQLLLRLPEIVTPNQLIQCLLMLKVDLLYFGGIGTFIRGSEENFTGDKANDLLRITASDVHAQVIGEGANLGVTSLARIELAQKGVLLNSDAIDNAGGVNCSDHEVNLKILLSSLGLEERNRVLESMSGEVIHHVLEGNSRHNHALDIMEKEAEQHHIDYCDLILELEKMTSLKRNTVFLDKDTILRQNRTKLTRPELAIVLSYTKNLLKHYFSEHFAELEKNADMLLRTYFPKSILEQYSSLISKHLLKKELVILMHVNRLVDSMGALQAFRTVFSSK